MIIEKMDDFFAARVDGYDEHMINNTEGCKKGYIEMARLLPKDIKTLLDLGCGTGLELHEIFKSNPNLAVTGIDLTQVMLDKLKEKYADKNIKLICASYFDYEFEKEKFDAVISFQTMHHFSHEDKKKLYSRIYKALNLGGQYIECDYMVADQTEEDFHFAENQKIREEHGIKEGEFYHYDTPCTINNQITLLLCAGFDDVKKVWRKGNTTIVIAHKN
jgi:cyclopropane fatty-acyl-phospholipid synthase-like methyltransferase